MSETLKKDEKNKTNFAQTRRISRILAFQALYSWDVGSVNIENLLSFSWIDRDSFEDDLSDNKIDENSTLDANGAVDIQKVTNEIKYCLTDEQLELLESLDENQKEVVFSFARLLINGTLENIEQIDSIIKLHLSSKWDISRINKVVLAVLRMSVYSLLYQKDIHSTVVIDEAVEIVKDYGEDDSHKFTNAILDNINKDLKNKE